MPDSFLHIDYRPGGGWLLTIMTRLHQSPSPTLRERMERWGDTPLREMGFALATKLRMLPLIAARLDKQLRRLGEELKNSSLVEEFVRRNAAYTIRDENLPYEMLIDLDSFFFESRSAYEIVGNFVRQFFHHVLGRRIDEAALQSLLTAQNLDTRWIEELRRNRILFFHKTAPWIAVRIVSLDPLRFDLAVLKRSIVHFTDPNDFVMLEQFRDIYEGFRSSLGTLHKWIIREIEEFEKAELSPQS